MKRVPYLVRYMIFLGVILGISFGIHIWIRLRSGLSATGDLLPLSYFLNVLMAFGIVAGLFMFRQKLKNQIGFLFIGGSLLKFLFFFIFFYPSFTADGVIDRGEFSSFFTPYLLSLVLETYFTSVMLRNLERENPG
ncbi:MAG: hypothetical protein P8X60_00380 [Robiginitalea sp.]|jgi:hypothetical protein